jgi:glutathione-regulated potassium-efflux system ancillary protein KefC
LPHFEMAAFLASTTGLLALISFCLLVFGRLGVGSIVAFLTAGLIVGQIRELPPDSVRALKEFAEIGVVLLLFLIGLEIQPSQLRNLGRDALKFGVPQIAVSVAVIGIYVWGTFAEWETAIVLGLGFALSSTTVVIQILKDRKELHTSWGEKAFAVLLAQDVAVVPFLLFVSFIGESEAGGATDASWSWAMIRAIIVVVSIVAVGRFVLTRILAVAVKQQNEPAFACVTFLGVVGAALAAERAGLSMALGTFLLGTTLSVSSFGHRIATSVEPVKSILLALFFLSVGLSIDLEVVASAWAPLLFNSFVILVLKFGVVMLLASAARLPRPDAVLLSVVLANCGEFGFVLFGTAEERGLMSPRLTALASILITISMLATPFFVRFGARWVNSAPGIPGQRPE